jgi:hypothetical protein
MDPMENDKTKTKQEDELQAKLKNTFGEPSFADRMTTRLPGVGPSISPFGYTSEAELREKVTEIVRRPQRKLNEKQLALAGIDLDPTLQSAYTTAQKKSLTDEEREKLGEKWLERLIESTRKRGRLMTDQQLADWRIGRKLAKGDPARYVGPDREEVTQAQLIVPRPHGQVGTITAVTDTKEGRLIIFLPDKAVEPVKAPGVDRQFVSLQVREHTPGWLHLERIPL